VTPSKHDFQGACSIEHDQEIFQTLQKIREMASAFEHRLGYRVFTMLLSKDEHRAVVDFLHDYRENS
jgi:hypothetical protein